MSTLFELRLILIPPPPPISEAFVDNVVVYPILQSDLHFLYLSVIKYRPQM